MVDGEWPEIFGEVTDTEKNCFQIEQYRDWLIDHIKQRMGLFILNLKIAVLEFLKEP